tara:strand:+ start:368 stop:553 length:186 start_codon:yes stop_codon:yes gene_type:complete
MKTITINRESARELTDMIEDSIEYWCQSMLESGELVSGETAYKIISAFAQAKEEEFKGNLK